MCGTTRQNFRAPLKCLNNMSGFHILEYTKNG